MTTLRQAAQQALEALELYLEETNSNVQRKAITSLRDALAQEEQEREREQEDIAQNLQSRLDAAKLLEERRQEIAQPRCKWQGLTEEEIKTAVEAPADFWATSRGWITSVARAVERALKEKNQ